MTPPDALPVLRGGSWFNEPDDCRAAYRASYDPADISPVVSFRVVYLPRGVAPPRMLLRGGSWDYYPRDCRSARRDRDGPGYAIDDFGFRVVCLPEEVAP